MKSPFGSACLEPRRSGEAAMLGRGWSCFLILRGRPRPRALEEGEGLFGSAVGSVVGTEMTTSFAVSVVGILGLRPRFRLVSEIGRAHV